MAIDAATATLIAAIVGAGVGGFVTLLGQWLAQGSEERRALVKPKEAARYWNIRPLATKRLWLSRRDTKKKQQHEETRLFCIRIGRANRMFLIRNSRDDTGPRLRHGDILWNRYRTLRANDNRRLSPRRLVTTFVATTVKLYEGNVARHR
jgi:hypothetical protein